MLLLFYWFAEDVEKRKKKPTHFSRRVGNVLAKSKELAPGVVFLALFPKIP